jgi:hypothetical protein
MAVPARSPPRIFGGRCPPGRGEDSGRADREPGNHGRCRLMLGRAWRPLVAAFPRNLHRLRLPRPLSAALRAYSAIYPQSTSVTDDSLLPVDGPARIGDVSLPTGQRIYGMGMGQPTFYNEEAYDPVRYDAPVAWVTSDPMTEVADAWLALSLARPHTGLTPILLSRAWNEDDVISGEAFGLYGPEDITLLDAIDPRAVLADGWNLDEHDELDPYAESLRAPFTARFPGLAPPQQSRLSAAVLRHAVTGEQPIFLGLVAVNRSADLPAAVGWSVFGVDRPGGPQARSLEIAAVLRSWEARFGACPLRIGSDSILRVLVERPPATLAEALRVAVEHLAFADEYGRYSGQPIHELAAELVGQPIWNFWWD